MQINNDEDLLRVRPEYVRLWKKSCTKEGLTSAERKRSGEIDSAIYHYHQLTQTRRRTQNVHTPTK